MTRFFEITYVFLRVILGYSLLHHGIEVFDPQKMRGYADWIPAILGMSSIAVAYVGKAIEFVTGILLILGVMVRPASVVIIVLFLIIAFKVGQGRVFMEEQHPFMFALFGLLFLAKGAGPYSLAALVSKLRRDRRP